MEVEMSEKNHRDDEYTIRKNRIHVYKSILNYYRGRSLSLDFILASKQPNLSIPPEMKTHEALCKDVQGLHDDIILIQSIKNSLKLINNSLTCTEIMRVNDINLRRDNINKIEGIIYFSKSIMKLYSECCSELDLIEKMKNYSSVLTEYMKSLDKLKESEKVGANEDSSEMEKAELQVYKINLMRTMKSVLIGYISLNCPDLLRSVQPFRSSMRRDLSVEDFYDTWDVGLP